jgi:Fic family protein
LVSAADRAIGKAEALQANFPGAHSLDRILRRQEATASCMVEGIECDLEDLLAVEETQDGSASVAARQVRDYALALDQWIPVAQDKGHAVITQDLISALHRQVMRDDDAYKDTPGRLRDRVVWIGGGASIAYSTFNPQPPAQVPKCLGEVIDYMQCDGMQVMTQGLLTRMAVAHAMFEAVHPFRDGNGRVGRLLLPLMMAAEGTVPLYLSPYIEAHKGTYYEALKAAQQRLEWDPIVGFMADAMVGTVAELVATRTALADLAQIWQTRRPFRQGSASFRALGLLPHYPVLTVNRLAEALVSSRSFSICQSAGDIPSWNSGLMWFRARPIRCAPHGGQRRSSSTAAHRLTSGWVVSQARISSPLAPTDGAQKSVCHCSERPWAVSISRVSDPPNSSRHVEIRTMRASVCAKISFKEATAVGQSSVAQHLPRGVNQRTHGASGFSSARAARFHGES